MRMSIDTHKAKESKDLRGESAKAIYTRLEKDREPYIRRAEDAAIYTIPALFPKQGSNSSTAFPTPYQSLGARGVNNLANKILLAIMPPNTPFFKLDVTTKAKNAAEQQGVPDIITDIQLELSKREQDIIKYMAQKQYSVTVGEGLKQLIVAGNYLFYCPPKEGGIKGYRLSHYVIQRDGLGKPIELVTKETASYSTIPQNVQQLLNTKGDHKPNEAVDIFTHIYYVESGDKYYSYQEISEEVISGTEQEFPADKLPWIPIRMTKVDGESYGRGYCEELIGDLMSLESLSKAIVQYAAAAARIVYLVNPVGMTQPRRLNTAKTGDFVPGRKEDIQALTLDKYNDFQVAKATVDALKQDLSLSFLLNSAVQRDAERVTAEEIRYIARELEEGLGGIYSILTQELQLPLVRVTINQMTLSKLLEDLSDSNVETTIITGLEAIGRGQDLDKLNQLLQYLESLPGAVNYMKLSGWLKVIITAIGLNADIGSLIKSDQEVQQELAAQQQQELASKAAPNLASGAMKMANDQQNGG